MRRANADVVVVVAAAGRWQECTGTVCAPEISSSPRRRCAPSRRRVGPTGIRRAPSARQSSLIVRAVSTRVCCSSSSPVVVVVVVVVWCLCLAVVASADHIVRRRRRHINIREFFLNIIIISPPHNTI